MAAGLAARYLAAHHNATIDDVYDVLVNQWAVKGLIDGMPATAANNRVLHQRDVTISMEPLSTPIGSNGTANLSVGFSGGSPVIQWFAAPPGATAGTYGWTGTPTNLSGASVTVSTPGNYFARLTSSCCVEESAIATVSPNGPVVPPHLTARTDAATASTVHLTWTPPQNMTVDHYEVNRGATLSSMGLIYSTPTSVTTSYDDTGLQSGIHGYVYSVKAVGPATLSTSNKDVVATVVFSTNTLDVLDIVRAVHFTKLLDAVNAIRTTAGLGTISFTAPAPNATPPSARVLKQHVLELRAGLDQGRSAVSATAVSYAELSPSKVKRQHVQELRDGVQ